MTGGKDKIIITLVILLFISVMFIAIGSIKRLWVAEDIDFVAGEYGEICYPEGNAHESIVYPHYFNTLEECTNYLNRNK